MPNWCYTNISIYHNDQKKLKEFFNKIDKWSKKTFVPNGFDKENLGSHWLGNIVGNAKLSKWVEKEDGHHDFEPDINCRGSINELQLQPGKIELFTETAWSPYLEMWQLLCDRYLPDATICYTAEEGGNGIYNTNDPDMIGKYYIDIVDTPPDEFETIEGNYEATEEELIKLLQKVLKTKVKDVSKLLDKLEESDHQEWLSINKWEEVSISDYN